jgi:hypothetical protein
LQVHANGAQRASIHRSIRMIAMSVLALTLAVGGTIADPGPAAASAIKVVVVVGPVGSSTAKYIRDAKSYAAQARSYGATVVELYSPNATWARVKSAAKGANILIYLGHGNGHPSPYGAFSALSKDGMGLNRTAGHGNNNTKYYGEYYMRTGLKLAKNSVVLLNHLCYASGDSEWGKANPPKATAMKRVDNYGAGFLRAGARAIFADGIDSLKSILYGLFQTDQTMGQIFMSDRAWTGTRDFTFASVRTPGYQAWLDPYAASRYYHSIVGKFTLTAGQVRAGG